MYLLFCLFFQRLLYQLKKFDGLVTLWKDNQLQDGDTVGQLGILEDDVISLIVDSAKEINVEIKLPYMTKVYTVQNSTTVAEMKKQLCEFGDIALHENEFDLIHTHISEGKILNSSIASEEFLPLHCLELMDSGNLRMFVHMKFQVKVTDPNGGGFSSSRSNQKQPILTWNRPCLSQNLLSSCLPENTRNMSSFQMKVEFFNSISLLPPDMPSRILCLQNSGMTTLDMRMKTS